MASVKKSKAEKKVTSKPKEIKSSSNKESKLKKSGKKLKNEKNNNPKIELSQNAHEALRTNSKAMVWALGSIFALVIAIIGAVSYLHTSKVAVISVTEDGRIFRPQVLTEPLVTQSRLLSFVNDCLQKSFAHDFINYRRTMNEVKRSCFTAAGARSFDEAMNDQLEAISKRRLILSATTEPSVISVPGRISGGRVVWTTQTPITIFYQGTTQDYSPQKKVAQVTVARVPLDVNLQGIAITSIQLMPYTSKR